MSEDEEFAEQCLKALAECHSGDIELDHAKADEALCEFLEAIGYADIVSAYNGVEKWYA